MARSLRHPVDELDALQEASIAELVELMARVGVSHVRGDGRFGQGAAYQLGQVLGETMAAAALFGRRRLLLEADAATKPAAFAKRRARPRVPFLPDVPFREAINDILEREPRLAPGWRRTQEVYTSGGFAAARAASEQIAAKIQEIVETATRRGTSQDLVERRILAALRSGDEAAARDLGINPAGWSRAYADTVFRTLTASSYARGRREQAEDPAIRRVMGGWRYAAVHDGDARPNHLKADGVVAAFDDPIWEQLSPPLGYRCRCSLEIVTRAELRARGVIDRAGNVLTYVSAPDGAGPDPRFVAGGGPL